MMFKFTGDENEDKEVKQTEEEEESKEKDKKNKEVHSPVNKTDIPKDSLIPTQIQHSKTVVGFHSDEISKSSSNKGKSKKLIHSDHFECSDDPPSNFQRCSTVGPEVSAQSEDSESSSKMRLSKSDTSLTDSFVMISENDALEGESVIRIKKKKKILKDGICFHLFMIEKNSCFCYCIRS